jgi:hypothetical protein
VAACQNYFLFIQKSPVKVVKVEASKAFLLISRLILPILGSNRTPGRDRTMKKSILAVLILLLVFPCVAWAGDIDGLWWNPDMGPSAAVMVRENGASVIAVELSLSEWSSRYSYCALAGTQIGNTVYLQNTPYCGVDIDLTMTITSPTTAIVKVNHCSPEYSGLYCIFPSGVRFNVEKAF